MAPARGVRGECKYATYSESRAAHVRAVGGCCETVSSLGAGGMRCNDRNSWSFSLSSMFRT